jgi:predicted CoA-substrate-specific enzyme activase
MNDKCAAGTGRFLEFMARALDVELMELGQLALHSEAPAPISSVCTVFAESEVVGLLADGVPREDIAAGLCRAVAQRAMALANQVGVREPVMVTGGVALNDGIIAALAAELGFEPLRVQAPQMVGAIGAASVGAERMTRDE